MHVGRFYLPGAWTFRRKDAATGGHMEGCDDVSHGFMMQLNAEAEALGWAKAARQHQRDELDLVGELGDQTRTGWFFHCGRIPTDAVYTELGSNWGAYSLALQRFFSTVYSVDANADKLAFQTIVAGQSQATNMYFIHSGPANVPLPNGLSDLILINLPRLDLCSRLLTANERPSRRAIFQEAHRLLAAGGCVCVLASGSAARIRQELSQAGLNHADCYWAWPRADTPRMSGSLDGRSIQYVIRHLSNLMRQKKLRQLTQLACHAPMPILEQAIQLYAPSLIVVAGEHSSAVGESPLPTTGSFVRLTLASRPQRGLHTTCLTLHKNGVDQAIRVSEKCDDTGRAAFSSQQTAGIVGRPLRTYVPEETQAAARWLSDFHKRTFAGYWAQCELEQEIEVLCDSVLCFSEQWIDPCLLVRFRRCYVSTVHAGPWPMVAEHGDFTPTNILVSQNGQLHVVDWEYHRPQGNPLIDLGAFCLSVLRRTIQPGKLPAVVDLGKQLSAFVSVYSSQLSLPVALSPAYYVLRWLVRVSNPQPGDEITALYAARTWASLLQPTVAIGLALQGNANYLLVRERVGSSWQSNRGE